MKSHQSADVGKNAKALKIPENVPWRLAAEDEPEEWAISEKQGAVRSVWAFSHTAVRWVINNR